jgi:TPR repeat protein
MVEHGTGVRADLTQAASLCRRSCDLGNGWGCGWLGLLLRDGRGGPRDSRRARELLQRGCELGAPFACAALRP